MYAERGCTVPITFEVYTNASAHGVEAHPIIHENDTHIEREWKEIYGYFNPVESHINTLWDELIPAFDYLLEMTPRLDLTVTGISGGVTTGATVDMSVEMTCLSPRLGTHDGVHVLGPDGTVLDTLIALQGDQTLTDHASITLPADLSSDMTILIGNNYTGYAEFVLSAGSAPATIDPLIVGAIIGVSIAAVVLIVYFVKFR
jgi:hypothetical protein